MDIYKLNFTILEMEVFALLCVRAGELFSQRDIAKLLNVSPTAVSNSVRSLEQEKLIRLKKTKTINFVSLNLENRKVFQLKRAENLKNLYKSGLIDYLEEYFAGSTIILFGSFSKGEDRVNSDIDIAVIGRKHKNSKLEEFESTLFRKININFYDSWNDIHKHLRNNILNGIVISGSVEL